MLIKILKIINPTLPSKIVSNQVFDNNDKNKINAIQYVEATCNNGWWREIFSLIIVLPRGIIRIMM